jgi:hypothetical protein
MGMFSGILEKLGFKSKAAQPASAAQPAPPAGPTASLAPPAPTPAVVPAAQAAPQVATITVVDVMGKLEGLAASNSQKLNWKESIVDLLKLLSLDSSFAARKELAIELGCPIEKMGDSAQMNIWLHKTVLRRLADNGGNIPKELLN